MVRRPQTKRNEKRDKPTWLHQLLREIKSDNPKFNGDENMLKEMIKKLFERKEVEKATPIVQEIQMPISEEQWVLQE